MKPSLEEVRELFDELRTWQLDQIKAQTATVVKLNEQELELLQIVRWVITRAKDNRAFIGSWWDARVYRIGAPDGRFMLEIRRND